AAAAEQLRALRGKTHALHSALALMRDGKLLFEYADAARLTMRMFSDNFLEQYLGTAGEIVTASVGAYQLEKPGIQLFERIEGDYFTILGVPVHDADAVVHRLYEGKAAPAIEAAFPGTAAGGKVDRARLAARVLGDKA